MKVEAKDTQFVHVRVRTACKKESIELSAPNRWAVAVRERAERGAANKRVRELLAETLRVPIQTVRLIKGATMPSKTYLLSNPK